MRWRLCNTPLLAASTPERFACGRFSTAITASTSDRVAMRHRIDAGALMRSTAVLTTLLALVLAVLALRTDRAFGQGHGAQLPGSRATRADDRGARVPRQTFVLDAALMLKASTSCSGLAMPSIQQAASWAAALRAEVG